MHLKAGWQTLASLQLCWLMHISLNKRNKKIQYTVYILENVYALSQCFTFTSDVDWELGES